jgi:3-mercaptopyruvate sulfurtransferase SseA
MRATELRESVLAAAERSKVLRHRKDLADRLQAIGIKQNERNISNKIARGGFTAVFFLQCMDAIGVHNLQLNAD